MDLENYVKYPQTYDDYLDEYYVDFKNFRREIIEDFKKYHDASLTDLVFLRILYDKNLNKEEFNRVIFDNIYFTAILYKKEKIIIFLLKNYITLEKVFEHIELAQMLPHISCKLYDKNVYYIKFRKTFGLKEAYRHIDLIRYHARCIYEQYYIDDPNIVNLENNIRLHKKPITRYRMEVLTFYIHYRRSRFISLINYSYNWEEKLNDIISIEKKIFRKYNKKITMIIGHNFIINVKEDVKDLKKFVLKKFQKNERGKINKDAFSLLKYIILVYK